MNTIAIIGAGRLGTSLGFALHEKGFPIKALSCRTLSSAQESRRIIGEGEALTNNIRTAESGDLVFLTVPDDKIPQIATELAAAIPDWSGKYVFHCSGLLSTQALTPLQSKGAATASMHPLLSFAGKIPDAGIFSEVYFGLEGNGKAIKVAQKIIHMLAGEYLIISAEDKPLYHAASSMASNFMEVLLEAASFLFQQAGISSDKIPQILFPLTKGTLHNVKDLNIPAALTGPVIRGDIQSIKQPLSALERFPPYYEIYRKLAMQALQIGKKEKKIPRDKFKVLESLLADE